MKRHMPQLKVVVCMADLFFALSAGILLMHIQKTELINFRIASEDHLFIKQLDHVDQVLKELEETIRATRLTTESLLRR
jgi:hypothetical protein